MKRYKCGLLLANYLLLHVSGLSPAQTRMLMKNLPALSKPTFNQQNQVLPLLLGLLSVFRASLGENALAQLITEPKALITVLNYSLLQRESGEAGPSYQVHPAVAGYMESKLGADKMRGYHLRAVEFYVSLHENILSEYEFDRPKSTLLAQLAKLAAQRGQTQLAQTLTTSLLEMHHHLFAAGEYEQAGKLVTPPAPFLDLIGRR